MMTDYEAVIGLETHIQLNTTTKIFCSCKADSWDALPNSNICPVCSGMPGVLPVLNQVAVEKGTRLAAAMHAEIRLTSYFDRKNYFYPDLPKGFQITQFDQSIGKGGYLDLPMPDGTVTHVRIHKLHLEEDAGKTKNEHGERLIDFNRCGVPLVEMVTEPDLRTADEAAQYLIRLRQLLRWIGVSEADMEKGHLRCDANVSIREKGSQVLNPKSEIKNINSIDAVRNAINFEIERQIKEVNAGRCIESWTLDWDDEKGTLKKMRSKETEADYRYFREPDLLPLQLSQTWVDAIIAELPELPLARRQRFMDAYGLSPYDAEILTTDRTLSDYYETAVYAYGGEAKVVSNWIMNDLLRLLNELNLSADELRLTPEYLADILKMIDAGKINASTGKSLLRKVQESGKAPGEIVEKESLGLLGDDQEIRKVVESVMVANPAEVISFREGKESLIGWFLGQVMRQTGGKVDPKMARQILLELLSGK
jgi:aspartyl-tRNA(Asn)/glutamyl-tRNA(Gln) amidotransferase subunit B